MNPKTNDEINKCLELIAEMLQQMSDEYVLKTYYSVLIDYNHTYKN